MELRNCEWCHEDFMPTGHRQKYCTPAHKKRAYRAYGRLAKASGTHYEIVSMDQLPDYEFRSDGPDPMSAVWDTVQRQGSPIPDTRQHEKEMMSDVPYIFAFQVFPELGRLRIYCKCEHTTTSINVHDVPTFTEHEWIAADKDPVIREHRRNMLIEARLQHIRKCNPCLMDTVHYGTALTELPALDFSKRGVQN